ncbi:hypothetical protein FVEN_g6469 [Fusarium venenatum]|uniref:uncharacterized protein n=1 Tax=Fusarium venenatum TaxID=56646 RepID=UPI001E10D36E|nr:hypothetical protein FVEN_g6469 [Fusarium venenatum]KAH6991893.1 hypothetical protein EDB82DRAFT_123261 [Fusarium venenatum]
MEESNDMSIERIKKSEESETSDIEVEDDEENPQNRRTRIPVGEIFKNETGAKNAENGEGPSPVISTFQRGNAGTIDFDKGFEKGHLTYAPSRRNPYYMAIKRDEMGEMFKQQQMGKWATETRYEGRPLPDTAIQSYCNVSLKLFHDVANDCVNWLSLSRLIDPQVPKKTKTKEKEEADMLKEMTFGKLLDYPENDPLHDQAKEESTHQPIVMPVNSMSQMALEETSQQKKKSKKTKFGIDAEWMSIKGDIVWEISEKKGRRIYVPVRHQMGWLMWLRLGTWEKTPEGRLAQLKKIKDGFKNAWMTATATDPESAAGYRARFSSANLGFPLLVVPNPENLIRRLNWQTGQVYTLFQSLVDKINNETSQDPAGMEVMKTRPGRDDTRYVEMGENPFGLFTTYISCEDFNKYMKSLEVLRGYEDQSLTRQDAHRAIKTDTKQVNDYLADMYQPMEPYDSEGQENYTQAQTDVMCVMEDWETKRGIVPIKQRLYVREGNIKDGRFGSTWRIDVSSDKISSARGKRIGKYAPAKIMGMPANEAVEKALGWQPLDKAKLLLGYEHRMSSGFFMAEWLHLCAFSWGGLTTLSQKGELLYRSSDIPGNLILGTSETNSVMTRFEKAWQTLVIDSPDLKSSTSCPKLTVTRNTIGKPVIRDVKNAFTGHYSRTNSYMSSDEKALAKAYDFLAYTIFYSISFPRGCKLLNMGTNSSLDTYFYPFLRPTYQKLEDQLDQALYEEMKKRHLNDPQVTSTNGAFNNSPYNQNGDTVNIGTRVYGNSGSLLDFNPPAGNGLDAYNSDNSDLVYQNKKAKK